MVGGMETRQEKELEGLERGTGRVRGRNGRMKRKDEGIETDRRKEWKNRKEGRRKGKKQGAKEKFKEGTGMEEQGGREEGLEGYKGEMEGCRGKEWKDGKEGRRKGERQGGEKEETKNHRKKEGRRERS